MTKNNSRNTAHYADISDHGNLKDHNNYCNHNNYCGGIGENLDFVVLATKNAIRNAYGVVSDFDYDFLVPQIVAVVQDAQELNRWNESKVDQIAHKIKLFHNDWDAAEIAAKNIMNTVNNSGGY